MSNYYLCLKTIDGEYKKLNITLSSYFERFSRFRDKSFYSLEDIDKFTSKFYDEYDLKSELFKLGIITYDDILGSFVIFKEGKYKKSPLKHGIVYFEEYGSFNGFSLAKLRKYILSMANSEYYSRDFLKKLVEEYCNCNYVQEFICEIREQTKEHPNPELNLQCSLENFINGKLYGPKNGKIVRYSASHDLGMFCIDYERKLRDSIMQTELYPSLTSEDLEGNRIEGLKKLQQALCPRKTKLLKREIDGQMSFF